MKNKNIEDHEILIELCSQNGQVTSINDAEAGNQVLFLCGNFVSLNNDIRMEKNHLKIIITRFWDIEVIDMDADELIVRRGNGELHNSESLLIYGLTARFEFLVFRSLDRKHEFAIVIERLEYGLTEDIIKEKVKSEYYKAYLEFEKLMKKVINENLCLYKFSFKRI